MSVDVIGVRELRQHASRYLARVEAGEEIGVTSKGRLVARLIPIQAGERSREALIESGLLVPDRDPGNLLDITPLAIALGERNLSDVLDEMRDE